MKKNISLTSIENNLKNLANKYESSLSYSQHEIEGNGHKILKHNYIFTIYLNEILNMKNLINDIKKNKKVSIDKIYDTDINKFIIM